MKRLLTLNEYIAEYELSGSDIWMLTKYEHHVNQQRFKISRDDVSTSYYLYGVEAKHFDSLVVNQLTFVSVRRRYTEAVIRQVLDVDPSLRDDERLSACIKTRGWCDKMLKEILE